MTVDDTERAQHLVATEGTQSGAREPSDHATLGMSRIDPEFGSGGQSNGTEFKTK